MVASSDQVVLLTEAPPAAVRVAVVTGANSGLGLEACRVLARRGFEVVMCCRTVSKGEEAAEELRKQDTSAQLSVMALDVSSLHSVERFCAAYRASGRRLDVLLCNAGMMMGPRRVSADGCELQLATNYLGHFHMISSLLALLKSCGTEAHCSRIIHVASIAARLGSINLADMMHEKGRYNSQACYSASKLAQVVHAQELARRLRAEGCRTVTVNSLEPGIVNTNLSAGITDDPAMAARLRNGLTVEEGARTHVFLAASAAVEGVAGKHFVQCRAISTTPYCSTFLLASRSLRPRMAGKLWAWTERLIAEKLAA